MVALTNHLDRYFSRSRTPRLFRSYAENLPRLYYPSLCLPVPLSAPDTHSAKPYRFTTPGIAQWTWGRVRTLLAVNQGEVVPVVETELVELMDRSDYSRQRIIELSESLGERERI